MMAKRRRGEHEDAGDRAPAPLRRLGFVALALLMSGALYLIAVRREAIVADLAAFAAWCF